MGRNRQDLPFSQLRRCALYLLLQPLIPYLTEPLIGAVSGGQRDKLPPVKDGNAAMGQLRP